LEARNVLYSFGGKIRGSTRSAAEWPVRVGIKSSVEYFAAVPRSTT
jgi:hypothetical protein